MNRILSPLPIVAATRTGRVDLLDPDPKTITLEAIAHGLAHLNRWNGALELPFSVAQHSILVMEIFLRLRPDLRRFAIYALLHDAHEYLLGDWAEPSFKAFCGLAARLVSLKIAGDPDRDDGRIAEVLAQTRKMQKGILDAFIEIALGLSRSGAPDGPIYGVTHEADQFARAIEWATFMPAANGPCPYPPPPFAMPHLKTLAAPDAAIRFAEAVRRELALLKAAAA